jgi:hypothetical protein
MQLGYKDIQTHLTQVFATPFANRYRAFLALFVANNDLVRDPDQA